MLHCSLFIVSLLKLVMSGNSASYENYLQERDRLINTEKSMFFGQDLIENFTANEHLANKILLGKKHYELEVAYKDPAEFLPSVHFFQAKAQIEKSEVFQLIRQIPKGASLHIHLTAGVSPDFLIKNITYMPELHLSDNETFQLRFLKKPGPESTWTEISELRDQKTPECIDSQLRQLLTLNMDNPESCYPTLESVWTSFKKIFSRVINLINFKPAFEEYVLQFLQELHDDKIFYAEVKSGFFQLYDFNRNYTNEEFFEIFLDLIQKFKSSHPDFLGLRFIFVMYRGLSLEIMEERLAEIKLLKAKFPDFIIGLDLVGFEEEGSLQDFIPLLLDSGHDLKYFFHAGETNWFGHTDLNLVDALLLNSSRIGHGFAITKHPELLKLAQERNVSFEICPISNQVLKLLKDPRDHPAVSLLAMNFPVVIGNDDPAIWNATGLSYDWYVAFMAMTPKNSGLEVLKKFALNSILYSGLEKEEERELAMETWTQSWDLFIEELITEHNFKASKP